MRMYVYEKHFSAEFIENGPEHTCRHTRTHTPKREYTCIHMYMCVAGMTARVHEIIIDVHLRTRNDRHHWLLRQRRKTTTNDMRTRSGERSSSEGALRCKYMHVVIVYYLQCAK